ncbi:MAG: hypothetical protein OHK0029_18640 [Armatimonadaceae bacterium]
MNAPFSVSPVLVREMPYRAGGVFRPGKCRFGAGASLQCNETSKRVEAQEGIPPVEAEHSKKERRRTPGSREVYTGFTRRKTPEKSGSENDLRDTGDTEQAIPRYGTDDGTRYTIHDTPFAI